MKKILEIENFKTRLFMCVFGVVVNGISVGFFKRAVFGVDPFQSMMSGLDMVIPISFGTLYVIANIILLLFSLFADRHRIGLATLINLFFLGYVAQFTHGLLNRLFPDLGIGGRVVCLIIGVVVMCLSASFYFTADLGVSTYDAVALVITENWHFGQFRFVRIVTDLICVGIGVLLYFKSGNPLSDLASMVGIGTIITAFFMGPLIDLFNRKVAQPFLGQFGSGKKEQTV